MTAPHPAAAPAQGEPTLLEKLDEVCDEIFERWDKDQRSGKLLSALAGRLPATYRLEVGDIRRALGAHADLLAALRQALVSVTFLERTTTSEVNRENAKKLLAEICAAIAKATGATP